MCQRAREAYAGNGDAGSAGERRESASDRRRATTCQLPIPDRSAWSQGFARGRRIGTPVDVELVQGDRACVHAVVTMGEPSTTSGRCSAGTR